MINLIACRILEKEIRLILSSGDFTDINCYFFPFLCTGPAKTRKSQNRVISEIRKKNPGDFIEVIACSSCGKKSTGEDLKPINDGAVKPKDGFEANKEFYQNCHFHYFNNLFYLLANKNIVDSYLSGNAYIITPGWLMHWRGHLHAWGFDRDGSRAFFKDSVKKIVFFNTGVFLQYQKSLAEFREYVGLPFVIAEVGTDYLKLSLIKLVCEKRNEIEKNEAKIKFAKANKISADYAMAISMINQLTNIIVENEAIKNIIEIYYTVFGAAKIIYVPLINGETGRIIKKPEKVTFSVKEKKELISLNEPYLLNISKGGFFINIGYLNEKYGVMEISEIPYPRYIEQYLNLAIDIANVCGLTISNARKYNALNETKERYRYIGFHDGLTGLYNREFFEEELKRINSDIARFRPVTIISADINWLKETNDKRGHKYGDMLIKGASGILSGAIRKTDTLARIGGDEFCMILARTDQDSGARVINNIVKNQEEFNNSSANIIENLSISIAIGAATNDASSHANISETVKNSDNAMYINKEMIKSKK